MDNRLKEILDSDLELLFSPKQIEILHAKLKKKKLSKTEEEYFSRVVKKKLKAILNPDLKDIARVILR